MDGEKLKAMRLERGMTQRQVAIACDLTQETIKNLERGHQDNPTLETLKKLADCYGVKVSDLLDE